MAQTESMFRKWLSRESSPLHWIFLVLLSVSLSFVLTRVGVPAAMLLGPMISGIVLSIGNARLRVPPPFRFRPGTDWLHDCQNAAKGGLR
jgi:uncharacterized protein